MSSDISELDLLVIQIDGMHLRSDLLMVGAIGAASGGHKHPLGVVEGATENTATVQALLDNLIERGLDPSAHRLFVLDGAKALSAAVRRTSRNVKRWRGAGMALRWTGARMLEAGKRMRRLRAYRQLPILRAALNRHHQDAAKSTDIDQHARAA